MRDSPHQNPPGLSFLGAAIWSIGATAIFQLVLLLALALRPEAGLDIVSGVACQAAAYLLALFVFLRVHEKETPLAEVVAFRKFDFSLGALAVALGVAFQLPMSALGALIQRQFPHSPSELLARAQHFEALTAGKQIVLVAAVCLIGPLVEELFFRGALYRGLRKRHRPGMTTIGVAAFFAAAHQDGRVFLPILLVGWAMTHLRMISGSLWPALLMHIAFNATSIIPTLGKPIDPDDLVATIAPAPALIGTAISLGLLILAGKVAERSPLALSMRGTDSE